MKTRNRTAKISLIGFSIVLFVALEGFAAIQAIQTPVNVVSAVWVTSESLYETGRVWTEIDAAPGDQNMRLRVTIQNLSNSTISGITAELKLQYPFKNVTGGDISRVYYSGSLSPGANAAADFIVNIDLGANPSEYKLKMTLNYLELASGVGKTLYFLKTTDVTVPVTVTSTRYMVIYGVVVSSLTTVPGGNITISGNLLNTGKINALNTNVTISSPILVRPASIIVGQVDPNVPRPFSAGVQVRRDTAPGTYTMTISVTHADIMACSHISRIEMRLTVRPAEARPPPVTQKPGDVMTLLFQILQNLLKAFFGLAGVAASQC